MLSWTGAVEPGLTLAPRVRPHTIRSRVPVPAQCRGPLMKSMYDARRPHIGFIRLIRSTRVPDANLTTRPDRRPNRDANGPQNQDPVHCAASPPVSQPTGGRRRAGARALECGLRAVRGATGGHAVAACASCGVACAPCGHGVWGPVAALAHTHVRYALSAHASWAWLIPAVHSHRSVMTRSQRPTTHGRV